MSDLFDAIEGTPAPAPQPQPGPSPAPAPAPVVQPPPDVRPPDVFDQIDAQPSVPPAAAMHVAAVAGQDLAPAQAAHAAALARVGVDPAAVIPDQKAIAADAGHAFDALHFDDIAARHPELAQWLSQPTNAAIARADLGNLRGLSTAVQALNPAVDDRPDLPLLSAFKLGVQRSVVTFNRTLLAGPSWLQQEARSLFGITAAPNPNTPLGLVYSGKDWQSQAEGQRGAFFRPSAARDLVSSASGILADPTTSLLLPAEGASLAIRGSLALGEAATARAAIAGAAKVQAVVAGGQTLIQQAEAKQADPAQVATAGNVLADTANAAVQASLGYFFGKLGQELPIQRALGATPFSAQPFADLGQDIVRNAVTGGSQAVAAGVADAAFTGQPLPSAGDLAALYASGAIPGGLMAAANVHEAALASRHLETIRHGEGLAFASKFEQVVRAAQAAQATEHGPEQVGALIDSLAKNRGVDHVYLQAGDWQEHFLAKGLDPVAEAQKAGLGDEYVQARGLGGDMRLPLRVAVGLGIDSENPAALAARVRQAPLAPNAIEAAHFFQAPDQASVDAAAKLAAQQVAAAQGDQVSATIAEDRAAQAVAAGRSADEAGVLGQLHQRFFARLADHFNAAREDAGGAAVTAQQLAEQFPLAIRRALPDVVQSLVDQGHLGTALDTLRTSGTATENHAALREALGKLGLDVHAQTNDEIAAALMKHAGGGEPAGATLEQRVPAAGIKLSDAEALRLRAAAEARGELAAPANPEDATGRFPAVGATTHDQQARGSLSPGSPDRPALLRIFDGADRSTVFHESAHYFLDVLSKLAARDGAPKPLVDDFNALIAWAGYGDRATMERMNAELATLQAKPDPTEADRARMRELAAPHEAVARGFESYLRDGKAPAVGLRRAFARLKAWLTGVYRDAKDLGVHLTPEVRGIFDRLLASHTEIERAQARVGDAPAFADQASSGMGDRAWAKYQADVAEAKRQASDHLERTLMAHEREAASEAYASDRAEVRRQIADQVSGDQVHNAIRQLQDGETWDGRKLAAPIKLAKADVERLLTPAERALLPGPGREKNRGRAIWTPEAHGLPADEVAPLLGYGSGHELLQALVHAPDRERLIETLTDAAMAKRHPDPMQDQGALDQAANAALHEPDARAAVLETERRQLAALLERERAKARDDAQRTAVESKAAADAAKLDQQAAEAAAALAGSVNDRRTADEVARAKANAAAAEAASRQKAADAAKIAGDAAKLADALGRQALSQATTHDERLVMRAAAEQAAKDIPLADLDPDRYLAAERKAAIAVAKALATKDYATALTQKRAQMMNAELARAAHAASEQVGKDQAYLRKAGLDDRFRMRIAKAGGVEWTVTGPDGTRTVFRGADAQEQARSAALANGGTFDRTSGYLEQMDALLERAGLKASPLNAPARQTLRDFLDTVQTFVTPDGERVPSGVYADIPQALIDGQSVRSRDMTVQDLHDLRSAVSGVEALAKQLNELMRGTKAERLEDMAIAVAEQVAKSARKNNALTRFLAKLRPAGDGTTGAGDWLRKLASNAVDSLIQVPRVVYEMDGRKEAGPLWRAFVQPAIEAGDRELVMRADLREKMQAAIDRWGKKNDPSIHLRRSIDGIDRGLSYLNRVVALMHYGNLEGRQRLLDLNGWDDAKVHRIIDTLDAKDIALANEVVGILSAHWSDVKALEERYNGVAPPKVEAIPVTLPNGVYEGGYQRLYYDGESATKLEHMAQEMREQGMVGGGYRRPATARGATKERVQVVKDRVLSLDPGNWTRALNEMVHDLTHRDLVVDQMKLVNHPEVRAAMQRELGVGVWQQFVNRVLGLAQGNKPATTALEKITEYARVSANYGMRAFNPAYALIQEAGIVNARARVKDRYLVGAQLQLLSGPLAIDHTARWIDEQSPTMKYRSRTRDANIGDALSETVLSSSLRHVMDGAGMFMVTKAWQHMDNVVWKGAYDQHRAETGADHAEAVQVANQVVESVMGSNKQKDIPEIMRSGGPLAKVFTSNMTWALTNWNMIATEWNRTGGGLLRYGQGGLRQVATGLGGLATLCVIGPMLWEWMHDEMKGADMNEWYTPDGAAKKAAAGAINSVTSSIPVVRDIAPAFIEGRDLGGSTTGLRWLKNLQGAGTALHAKHYGEATAKAVAGAAGTFLPLPSAAIFQAMDGYKYAEKRNAGIAATAWAMMNGPPPKHHAAH